MTKKATILQSYGLFPDFRVQRQIELLRGLDLEIEVINWKRLDTDKCFPVPDIKLHTVIIESKYGLSSLELMQRLPKFWRKAHGFLKKIKPDLLVCNNFDTLVPAIIYKLKHGGIIVYVSREPYHKVTYLKTGSKIAERFFWLLEMLLIKRVDHVVTVTPNMVKMYKKMGRDANFYPNAPTGRFIKDSFPRATNEVVTIGFVGNIRPGFSIELMWDVVRDINREAGELKLKLLLCGPHLDGMATVVEAMKNECSECLEVLAPVKVEEIPSIYQRIDVAFSLPENNEKFSKYLINVKMFESLAAGVPVISNSIGENRTILGDNISALWLENDYKMVREGIEKLIQDPALRIAMGDAGREFVTNHFNWGLFEEQYRELLIGELEKMESLHD